MSRKTEEQIPPAEKPDSHVTLEIGCGKHSILELPEDRLREFENNPALKYIGIDVDRDVLMKAKKNLSEEIIPNSQTEERIILMQASGEKLPLSDESINEIIMANVLGEPRPFVSWKMLEEVRRVLKKRGILKVIETYSPEVAKDRREEIFELLRDKLNLIKEVNRGNLHEADSLDKRLLLAGDKDSFIWQFEKNKLN